MVDNMIDNHVEEVKAMATCSKCLKKEQPGDVDQMLLCDGCDLEIHVSCAGLKTVPTGDWLCEKCLEVMDARRRANMNVNVPRDSDGVRSLKAQVPPLPQLDVDSRALGEKAQGRFNAEIAARRDKALSTLLENQRVLEESSKERISTLTRDVQSQTAAVVRAERSHAIANNQIFSDYELCGWSIAGRYGESHIKYRDEDGSVGTVYRNVEWVGGRTKKTKCPDWDRYDKQWHDIFTALPLWCCTHCKSILILIKVLWQV